MMWDEWIEGPRITYEEGATFVRVCFKREDGKPGCGRFVRADPTVLTSDAGLHPGPNATCSKCGRVRMGFEGFY